MVKICRTHWLGLIEYGAALSLQKELVAQRAANEIPDTLLLLEHSPTYTVGIHGHSEHLLVSRDELRRLNIAYHRVDRGGSVTFHGPGQLVCYPILDLKEHGYNYHEYLKVLEKVIIQALAQLNVRAFRERGQPGVWVFTANSELAASEWARAESRSAQIATIGVKLNEHQITSHGFSINVNPELHFFDLIMPCGVSACQVSSLQHALNRPFRISSLIEPVIKSFGEVFGLEVAPETRATTPAILFNSLVTA